MGPGHGTSTLKVTVNHVLAPGARVAAVVVGGCGSSPHGPQACASALSPPSGRIARTWRSVMADADALVTCKPNCRSEPSCAEHPGPWLRGAPPAASSAWAAAPEGKAGAALPAARWSPAAYPAARPAPRPAATR